MSTTQQGHPTSLEEQHPHYTSKYPPVEAAKTQQAAAAALVQTTHQPPPFLQVSIRSLLCQQKRLRWNQMLQRIVRIRSLLCPKSLSIIKQLFEELVNEDLRNRTTSEPPNLNRMSTLKEDRL